MSPALNGSSDIQHFERSDVIDIRDGLISISTRDYLCYQTQVVHFLCWPPVLQLAINYMYLHSAITIAENNTNMCQYWLLKHWL